MFYNNNNNNNNNNKIFGHTWRFQGRVDGLNRKRHFDVLRDKLGKDAAPKKGW